MIHVTIELWPGGNREQSRLLGEAFITNTGSARDAPRADYHYTLKGKQGAHMHSGMLHDFPRQRLHVWDLLARVLLRARF